MPTSLGRRTFNARLAHHQQLIGKWEERVSELAQANDQSPAGRRSKAHAQCVLQEQYDNCKRFLNRYGKNFGYHASVDTIGLGEEAEALGRCGPIDSQCTEIGDELCMLAESEEVPDFFPAYLLHPPPFERGKRNQKKARRKK
jgi:hypothetical protein